MSKNQEFGSYQSSKLFKNICEKFLHRLRSWTHCQWWYTFV